MKRLREWGKGVGVAGDRKAEAEAAAAAKERDEVGGGVMVL